MGARAYLAEAVDNGDGTFDLMGVEILSAGGPIHGIGSPPEGDYWTVDELREMAAADGELGEEIQPPAKIGHPDEQVLLQNSIKAGELPAPTTGELPAVGWLEDLRVEGTKLLADVRRVPTLVADLIQKGAYRTRSVELSKVTSQESGKVYEWVVTGLAWLGGTMPAVRTLGDVAALYEGETPITRRTVIYEERDYAPGDIVWNPRLSFQTLRADLQEALNPGTVPGYSEPRWYVVDVAIDYRCLVEDWMSSGPADAYVVAFTVDDAGTVSPAAFEDWIKAERTWIETAKEYAEQASATVRNSAADTRPMKFTDEQRRKFSSVTGLKFEDVTDKMLEDAGVASEPPAPPAEPAPPTDPAPAEEPTEGEGDEQTRELSARLAAVETELNQERRNSFIRDAVKAQKIHPGQTDDLKTFYERDPEGARKFVESLPARDDLREYGADNDPDEDGDDAARSYEQTDPVGRLGIRKEELV